MKLQENFCWYLDNYDQLWKIKPTEIHDMPVTIELVEAVSERLPWNPLESIPRFELTHAEITALLNEMEHEYIINPIVRDTLARMMRFSDELARRDNKST